MASRGTTAVAVAVVVGSFAAETPSALGAPPPVATVVLHVENHAQVPAGQLAEAQAAAAKAYAQAGIELRWTDGAAVLAEADGLLHLDVALLDAPMTARMRPDRSALGLAGPQIRKAYIFYDRVVREATRTVSALARVLGYVLAHEIGHMLLPEYSHVPAGLMQPSVPRWIADVPAFLPAQAATLRTILTTAN